MKIAYYPGCSSQATALEYNESVHFTARHLGIDLEEMPDWNCCGASSGHIIDQELGIALPSRNLALAERMAVDIITACPSCFLRHKIAEHELKIHPHLKARIEDDIGMNLQLTQKTKHILEVLYHDIGIDTVQAKVQKPLKGLKVVTYYGCYLVRPPEIMQFDDPEDPTIMDKIMLAMGANVLDWSGKVDCCGGGLSLTTPGVAIKLVQRIIAFAREVEANAIVTACNLCQANLDIHQGEENQQPIPIFYFSELTALAFGCLHAKGWFEKHMINPFPLLDKLLLV